MIITISESKDDHHNQLAKKVTNPQNQFQNILVYPEEILLWKESAINTSTINK